MNKLTWLVLIVLQACILGLVVVDISRNGTSYQFESKNDSKGLQCVYNCEYFSEVYHADTN